MCYVNSYLQLFETTKMWDDLFISKSSSRLHSHELLSASINSPTLSLSRCNSWFSEKNTVYIIVSLVSLTAFSLINLQQRIFIPYRSLIINIESLCLLPERGVGCLRISSATTATMGVCLHPCSSRFSLPFLLQEETLSQIVFSTSWNYLFPKLNQNFPFLKV